MEQSQSPKPLTAKLKEGWSLKTTYGCFILALAMIFGSALIGGCVALCVAAYHLVLKWVGVE